MDDMATRILINGQKHTFNPQLTDAQALAVHDGVITAVGKNTEILNLADGNTTIEDLHGYAVLPPFCDAHIHLLEYGFSLLHVDTETPTRAKCLQRVAGRARQSQPGDWVLGHGWNHNIWPEGIGTRQMLDEISPANPVYLTHKSLHRPCPNSAALQLAGITSASTDPAGGQYCRGEDGQLTGILLESAMRVVEAAIPHPDASAREEALLQAQNTLLEFGITSVHDFDPWDCFSSLSALETKGLLKMRVVKGVPYPNLDEAIALGLRSGQGSSRLAIGWLKLFADGALGPQTAAMLAAYENSDSTGMLFLNSENIQEIGRKALSHGISLAVHAIGDRANREVINGYAQLTDSGLLQKSPLPLRIEHVQLIDPQDIQRLAALGIMASMQPIHAPSDRGTADRHWGTRCAHAYAWQSVRESGTRLIFGSDAPVESPNPYWGLYAALTRKLPNQPPSIENWHTEQCLSLPDALEAYIRLPHAISGNSAKLGILKAGHIADLSVFTRDPLRSSPQELVSLRPAAVMIDGSWLFNRIP